MAGTRTAAPAKPSAKPDASEDRLLSVDAYRGFVMLALAAEGFGIAKTARNFPDSKFWQTLGSQFEHVPWVGCAFWDLIQPSFMFLVGVAVPWSLANRQKRGESRFWSAGHAVLRSVLLILLGIFLMSDGRPETNYTFVNVLSQIGLGYFFLYVLTHFPIWTRGTAVALILVGYWAWFAFSPLPPPNTNLQALGVPPNWPELLTGFEAHWQKNANPAAEFDYWFLNQFPRSEPYRFNSGGYQTLNFIPSLATMLLGSIVGTFLQARPPAAIVLARLAGMGVIGLLIGYGLDVVGLCPLVKRIWTPSWVLFSTGWCLLILAAFYGLIDGLKWRWWAFPLLIAGMNSIVLYLCSQLLPEWTAQTLRTHFGQNVFAMFGTASVPLVEANLVMLAFWLFVWWLARQKIFVRI